MRAHIICACVASAATIACLRALRRKHARACAQATECLRSAGLSLGYRTPASEWTYDRILVRVYDKDTIANALQSMHTTQSDGVLVVDDGGKLLGVIDTLDAVRHLLRAKPSTARNAVRLCTMVKGDTCLDDVYDMLCTGVRRIAIEHDDGTHQIASQRSLAQALYEIAPYASPALKNAFTTKVRQADLGSRGCVWVVSKSASARRAFELMAAYDISSMPVCDEAERAIGVVSVTDALHAHSDVSLLDEPVLNFLAESRAAAGRAKATDLVVGCSDDDTMWDVLCVMLERRVHHVYVLEDGCPLAVVSFVDILRCLRGV